jgi:uncharacterized protein involved in exopolysaccharide biosynthesis
MDPRILERKREPEAASPNVSRVLIVGFLVAALLGLVAGIARVGWNLVTR